MYDRRVIRGNTYATVSVPAVPSADKNQKTGEIMQKSSQQIKENVCF